MNRFIITMFVKTCEVIIRKPKDNLAEVSVLVSGVRKDFTKKLTLK